MSRRRASWTVAWLLALMALGGAACARPAAPVPSPAAARGGVSSSFSPRYIGSGLPREGSEAPIDLYAVEAADLPSDLAWLNTSRPLALAQLRGKVVLVHFWDVGCIECVDNFYDLARLQGEYADYLVVIGVHSARLYADDPIEALREVLDQAGITHPVAYDPRQRTWYDWGVQASPTLVLVDPAGSLAHMHVGLDAYREFRPLIGALVDSFSLRDGMDPAPLQAAPE